MCKDLFNLFLLSITIISLTFQIFSQETIMKMSGKPYGLLLELTEEGAIRRSLHDPTGEVIPSVSEAEDDYGTLFLGSYHSSFIGKVELPKRL